jgi:FtsH-binding integral membrane protein
MKQEIETKTGTKNGARTDVFGRQGSDSMGRRAFLALIGGSVLYGMATDAIIATQVQSMQFNPGWSSLILCGLVFPMAGVVLAKSSQAQPCFLGYNMILVPFGVLLGPVISAEVNGQQILLHTLSLTICITVLMVLLGISYPKLFSGLGNALLAALASLLAARIIQCFVPDLAGLSWIDWVFGGVFSLFIAYDCHRASMVPATPLNALGVAVNLYLEIINLFLSILKINKD